MRTWQSPSTTAEGEKSRENVPPQLAAARTALFIFHFLVILTLREKGRNIDTKRESMEKRDTNEP